MSRLTSDKAYAAVMANGRISDCRKKVYSYLYQHGPKTRNEIDRALSNGEPNPPYSRRLVEMERMAVLARVGTRKGTGGLESDLWDVTDQEPIDPPKREKAKPSREKAFAQLARLLKHPRAKVFPDSTLEAALAIVESVETESEVSP